MTNPYEHAYDREVYDGPLTVQTADFIKARSSQASPVGEAPREALWSVEHLDSLQDSVHEDVGNVRVANAFRSLGGTIDRALRAEEARQTPSREETAEDEGWSCDECSDRYPHVHTLGPRTSEEPTEGHWRRLWQQTSARADRAEARVSELERALAEAREALEVVKSIARANRHARAVRHVEEVVDRALARPRSTESAPEEGSDA